MFLGGGTQQDLWTDHLLQLFMLPALVHGLAGIDETRLTLLAKAFVGLVLLVIAAQFLPVYRAGQVINGQVIGEGWGFYTPMPEASLDSALFATAVIGFALYLSRFSDHDQTRLLRFILVGFFVHLIAGTVQLSFDRRATMEGFWPYEIRAGLFANENHFATLIFVLIPLIAWFYLVRVRRVGIYLLVVAIIVAFQFANDSRAGMAISSVLALACLFWMLTPHASFRHKFGGWAIVLLAALAVAWLLVPLEQWQADARWDYLPSMLAAIRDHWLTGSGLGTFVTTFPAYEARKAIDHTYVNHAHNDWLEIVLELGIAGALLIVAFFALTFLHAARTPFAQAAFLSILALATHSLVDYPLRTMTNAVLFGFLSAVILSARPFLTDAESGELSDKGIRSEPGDHNQGLTRSFHALSEAGQ